MARPLKNNADYFPHDAAMRNDPKIKAVRRKFGIQGYGIYCMVVEYLTDADHFSARVDDLGYELMAGDFDIERNDLEAIVSYCAQIDLFQIENNFLQCYSLVKRLNPLLSKRKHDRTRVIADNRSENQYSKVKESKGKESKEDKSKLEQSPEIEKNLEWFVNCLDEMFVEQMKMTHRGKDLQQAAKEAFNHMAADKHRLRNADEADVKRLVNTWLSNQKIQKNGKTPGYFDKDKLARLIEERYGAPGTTEQS